ncbi:MAG: hypothetical protein ACYTFK_13015, partial [Planctomycetota bacterium]
MLKARQKGFVKYEVVIATLLVAVMTVCVVVVMSRKLGQASSAACDRNIKMIVRQFKVWNTEKGTYP